MTMRAKSGAVLVPGGIALAPDHWYALRGGGVAYVTSESVGQVVAFGMVWARPPRGGGGFELAAPRGGDFSMVEREWQWNLLDGRSIRREVTEFVSGSDVALTYDAYDAGDPHPYDVVGELRQYCARWDWR